MEQGPLTLEISPWMLPPASPFRRLALPLEASIVSASPIYARAIQQLLESGPIVCRTRVLSRLDLADPCPEVEADVVLVAPQNWEELAAWLPVMRLSLSDRPWLLLAELRLAGMFLSVLHDQPCALVTPGATPEELEATLRALADCRVTGVEALVLSRFAGYRRLGRDGRRSKPPTAREVQCGCAVSLGLNNRRIAGVLHISEATVKTHLHQLLDKLELEDRVQLGAFFYQALHHEPPGAFWN